MSKTTKTVYILLFLALVFQPHLSLHISGIPRPYVESLVTLVILVMAYATYKLSNAEIFKKEEALQISEGKLTDSWSYIGKANRRLELVPALSTRILSKETMTKNDKKLIFTNVLNTVAVSIAKTDWALLRFVRRDSEQIIKEFLFSTKESFLPPKHIGRLRFNTSSSENGMKETPTCYLIATTDRNADIQAHLILPKSEAWSMEDYPIIQAITDQTQLLFTYLYARS